MVDLTGIYRIWNPRYKSYSVFSQDHLCRVLLGFDTSGSTHDAVRPLLSTPAAEFSDHTLSAAQFRMCLVRGSTQQAHRVKVTDTRRFAEELLAAAVQAGDAVKSMRLFRQYQSYQGDPASWTAAQVGYTSSES